MSTHLSAGRGHIDPPKLRLAVAVLLTAMLGACSAAQSTPIGSLPPATPSASERLSPDPTDSPSATDTASPATTPGPITAWQQAESFDESPATSYVIDVTAWSGGFVAVGSAWESEYRVGPEMPALWTSVDGAGWEERPIDLGVDDVTLIGVAARGDGQLLLVGNVPGSGGNPDAAPPRSIGWISADAVTWEEVALPISDDATLASLAHGPRGYVLGATTPYVEFAPNADQTPGELWHSPDGIAWTKTHEGAAVAVAGDEGFVAIQSALAAGPSSVVASADGVTWNDGGLVAAPLLDVAPLGGDWVAVGYAGEPATLKVLHSPNGLDWTPVVNVDDLTGPDGPKVGPGMDTPVISEVHLTGEAGHAFLMLGQNHCCAQMGWTFGVWSSADGTSWSLAIEGNAFVSSVASSDATMVLGGHLGRGDAATFWIGAE